MSVPPELQTPGGLAGLFITILGALWFVVRRKVSSDSTGIATDKAETGLISRLQKERDEAVGEAQRVRAQRTADAERIATLKSENAYLKAELRDERAKTRKLISGLPGQVRKFLQTNVDMLGDVDERIDL
jgi:hypothetical protein